MNEYFRITCVKGAALHQLAPCPPPPHSTAKLPMGLKKRHHKKCQTCERLTVNRGGVCRGCLEGR